MKTTKILFIAYLLFQILFISSCKPDWVHKKYNITIITHSTLSDEVGSKKIHPNLLEILIPFIDSINEVIYYPETIILQKIKAENKNIDQRIQINPNAFSSRGTPDPVNVKFKDELNKTKLEKEFYTYKKDIEESIYIKLLEKRKPDHTFAYSNNAEDSDTIFLNKFEMFNDIENLRKLIFRELSNGTLNSKPLILIYEPPLIGNGTDNLDVIETGTEEGDGIRENPGNGPKPDTPGAGGNHKLFPIAENIQTNCLPLTANPQMNFNNNMFTVDITKLGSNTNNCYKYYFEVSTDESFSKAKIIKEYKLGYVNSFGTSLHESYLKDLFNIGVTPTYCRFRIECETCSSGKVHYSNNSMFTVACDLKTNKCHLVEK